MADLVKNLPAVQETKETWVRFLGWEDPLEKEKATHSNIFAWGNPMDRRAWRATVHGVAKKSDRTQRLKDNSAVRMYISVIKLPKLRYLVMAAQVNTDFYLIKMLMVANMWILAICCESDSVMSDSL